MVMPVTMTDLSSNQSFCLRFHMWQDLLEYQVVSDFTVQYLIDSTVIAVACSGLSFVTLAFIDWFLAD